MKPLLFTDPDNGKTWALHPDEQNYLEKFIGFCNKCEHAIFQYAEINFPSEKRWLKVNCQMCNPLYFRPYNIGGRNADTK